MKNAEYFIEKLGLEKHIEGGYYRETYRSKVSHENRSLSTSIYFLLKSGQVSKFHKLKSDEIWYYHHGSPILIHMINKEGEYSQGILGINSDQESPQLIIPADTIFGAEPVDRESFSLVSCMVSPGFDFEDFTLYSTQELIKMYPSLKKKLLELKHFS
jgi:predicted cupin superfamily sugar epimerase